MNKKLNYSRGTARCVESVEILPTATQECRNYDTTSPEQIEVMKLEGYSVAMCNKRALNTDAIESLPLSYRCHKRTDEGRIVYIACIPTTCCGEIFSVHNVEIARVTLTTPT